MVLWELTLATAYFLGLKRTYRLGLRIQRRVVPQRFRSFTHRRTRFVFDTVIKVQNKFKVWDLNVGKRLGDWLLGKKPVPTLTPGQAVVEAKKVTPELEKFPPPQGIRAPPPASFGTNTFPVGWRPMNKKAQNSERLYSVIPERLAVERSLLKKSLIREDIAAYVGLSPKPRGPL